MTYLHVSDQWVELGAKRRTANCLAYCGIDTLEQLLCVTDEELMGLINFGKTSLTDVHELLRRHWHDVPPEQRKTNVGNLLSIYESEIAEMVSLEAQIPQQENYWGKFQIGLEADKHKIAIERIREKILAYV